MPWFNQASVPHPHMTMMYAVQPKSIETDNDTNVPWEVFVRLLHGSNASPAFNHHCSTLKAQISYAKYITGKFYYKIRQAKKISSQECNITECQQAATRHQYNIPSTYRNITSVENVSATILPSSVRRSYQSMSTRHTYI